MHHLRTLALYGIEHDLNELNDEPDQNDNLKSDEEDDRGPIDEGRSSKKALSLPKGNSGNEEGFWFPRR